jgi:2-iminobutanoate/2-iminopropanoate deaminase
MKSIHTDSAPKAVGPYSQGVLAGSTLYVSGQLPINPDTTTFAGEDISSQTRQSLNNGFAVVEAAGMQKTDIVKCGVFLQDLNDFQAMNAVYSELFGDHKPARFAVQVARLPLDAKVEIDAVAVKETRP